MTSFGRVREWHADDGWGVIDSSETPDGCWAHFSAVLVDGYKMLEPGQDVELVFEVCEQDGFSCRAVEVWPLGQTPVRTLPEYNATAYSSTLHITIDPKGPGPS